MCKTVFAYGTGSTGSFRETGTSPSPGEGMKSGKIAVSGKLELDESAGVAIVIE